MTVAPRRAGVSTTLVTITLLAVLLLAYLYQAGWVQRVIASSRPTVVDPTGAVQVFFTTPTLIYPDQPWQRPTAPLLEAVLADIANARASIDLASFDFDIEPLTAGLLQAQRRGVAVRLVVDSENLLTPEVSEQTGRLQRAGVAVRFDRREPFMHNKVIVIDGAITWLGSWNLTTNDTYRNNNNMIRLVNRRVAAEYAREFAQLHSGRFGTSKRSGLPRAPIRVGSAVIQVYFAPQDRVRSQILPRLQAARHNIRFMAFSFTAQEIADAMLARAAAGVRVQGVFEAQNATGRGASYQAMLDRGADVLLDGNCYIMHHKAIVIDDRIVITGSYNFTNSAERSNDENLIVMDDPAVARAYLEEFERIYAQAQAPTRCR